MMICNTSINDVKNYLDTLEHTKRVCELYKEKELIANTK